MKRVKVMLISIVLFAVVGGALAFKASSRFGINLCTTSPRTFNGIQVCTDIAGNALICADDTIDRTITFNGTSRICWSSTTGTTCRGNICPNLGYTTTE